MANPYFSFKQFTVYHDRSTLRVCTDSCVFGSWIAPVGPSPQNILDIGTGSGLLALMLAQRFREVSITAIETDENSCRQARQNFEKSVFSAQLTAIHADILKWPTLNESKNTVFDLIVCNPPFFKNHLQSHKNESHNLACHQQELTLDKLAQRCAVLTTNHGQIAIMLPPFEMTEITKHFEEHGWHINQKTLLHNKPGKPAFRELCIFGKQTTGSFLPGSAVIYVKDEANNYSKSFVSLLKPFYLYL